MDHPRRNRDRASAMACFAKRPGQERCFATAEDSDAIDPAERQPNRRRTRPPFSRGAWPTAGRQTAADRSAAVKSARNSLTRPASYQITAATTDNCPSAAANRNGVQRETAADPAANRAAKIHTGNRERDDLRNSRARRSGRSGIAFAPLGCFALRPVRSPGPTRDAAGSARRNRSARNLRATTQYAVGRND